LATFEFIETPSQYLLVVLYPLRQLLDRWEWSLMPYRTKVGLATPLPTSVLRTWGWQR
jgi:hypothetical protein